MGRPAASKASKEFGVFFSNIVTVPVASRKAMVLRSGEGAIFHVFAQTFPGLIREQARCGLTQLEFNKHLQNNGFSLTRRRITKFNPPERKALEFFPLSSFSFSGRRWRNPDTDEDLAYLRAAWPVVTREVFAPIPFESFVDVLRKAILLDIANGDMDGGSDAAVECSTPENKRVKLPFEDSNKAVFESEGHEAKQNDSMVTMNASFSVEEQLGVRFNHDGDRITWLPIRDSYARKVTRSASPEQWIDAQTFLDQSKSNLDMASKVMWNGLLDRYTNSRDGYPRP